MHIPPERSIRTTYHKNLKVLTFYFMLLPLIACSQMIEGLGNDEGELVMVYDCVWYELTDSGLLERIDTRPSSGFMIQNSLPRGDQYFGPDGTPYASGIFWNRFLNSTNEVIEVDILFSPDSLLIPTFDNAYYKLHLPPDTMSVEKEKEYNYGAEGLTTFLDKGLNEPTRLRRAIQPGQEILFYTGVLSHNSSGVLRTGYVLEGDRLLYRVHIKPHMEPTYIPCGSVKVR